MDILSEFSELPVYNEMIPERSSFLLLGNSPNPFIETTNIYFQIAESEQITFTIFDISGKKVMTLQQDFPQGEHSFLIEKKNLPAKGIYFYEIKTEREVRSGKIILQ